MRISRECGWQLFAFALLLITGACVPHTEQRDIEFPPATGRIFRAADGQPRVQAVSTTFGGQVRVFVGPSTTDQYLYLTSGDVGLWQVYLYPGAKVRIIYLIGSDAQMGIVHLSRLARGETEPKIVDLNMLGHEVRGLSPPVRLRRENSRSFLDDVKAQTGLSLTHFTGRYYVWGAHAFAISDAPTDVASLSRHFPQVLRRNLQSPMAGWRAIRRDVGRLVKAGRLPANLQNEPGRPDPGSELPLIPDEVPTTTQPIERLCGRFQLGTQGDDRLWCDEKVGELGSRLITKWVVAGSGNDVLTDRRAMAQLMSGGPGDDLIASDGGNDLLYFEPRWGRDLVTARCFADMAGYVVFGRGIDPRQLHWIGSNVIEDRKSGSRIRFAGEPCFHFIAVEPGRVPPPPSDSAE